MLKQILPIYKDVRRPQLGRFIHDEAGILWRSFNLNPNGWQRLAQSYELQFCKKNTIPKKTLG